MVLRSPTRTVVGLAEHEIVGGCITAATGGGGGGNSSSISTMSPMFTASILEVTIAVLLVGAVNSTINSATERRGSSPARFSSNFGCLTALGSSVGDLNTWESMSSRRIDS